MSQNNNYGGNQININELKGNIILPPRAPIETALLKNVGGEVESRLAESLHKKPINLSKELQPKQVENPQRRKVKISGKPVESLASTTTILEVFESAEISGRLLILGEPGAGKTTTMLELARELVKKAKDVEEPIPVLFDLSSWKGQDQKNSAQSIFAWLVKELQSKYKFGENINKDLLTKRRILPMLDGLDEVKPEFQAACVKAINQWLNQVNKVVVCSRWEEYEKVVRGQWERKPEGEKIASKQETRLQLNGAVLLQALTVAQIQACLSAVEQTELWNYLQYNKELLKLMKVPLLLSMAVLSYKNISLQQWQPLNSDDEERKNLLLEAYIKGMFERELNGDLNNRAYRGCNSPSHEQTKYWLKFLAQQLSQTEFLIEDMQLSWLQSIHQRKAYQLLYGALGGIFIGKAQIIQPVEELRCSFLKNWSALLAWILTGLPFGLFVGLLGGIIYHQDILKGGLIGFSIGLIFGLVQGVPGLLSHGLKNSKIPAKVSANQGIRNSVRNALFTATIVGIFTLAVFLLLYGLISKLKSQTSSLSESLINGLSYALISGLIAGITFGGGKAAIQHFALRFVLYRYGYTPWNYAQFLDYCTELCFLQRVGGRYRFIHKLLQEHFSKIVVKKSSSRVD